MVVGILPTKLLLNSDSDVTEFNEPIDEGSVPIIPDAAISSDVTFIPEHTTPVQLMPEHKPLATRLPPEPLHCHPDHPSAALRAAIFVEAIRSQTAMCDPGGLTVGFSVGASVGETVGTAVGMEHW